ncbi:reticulon-like protein B23 [Phragmites australis]|uniref:reticulon-like protein B23 n=1 Tax=Phragmites australis TaxID=29695 RepID=UPI002D7725EE|nr:reticulon-like protein B23 [Phragmites australis]
MELLISILGLLFLLCSLSILGLLFCHLHISVPVDPLEWQISQEMANSIVASLANTVGAAESVLRVAATEHDKKLFFKVGFTLYFLAALGRVVSGAAIAYAVLCIFCLYMFAQSTDLFDQLLSWVPVGRDLLGSAQVSLDFHMYIDYRVFSSPLFVCGLARQ